MNSRLAAAALFLLLPLCARAQENPLNPLNPLAPPSPSTSAPPSSSSPSPSSQKAARSNLDVEQLFATTCGWCHNDGGRKAGKGPQLMGTKRSDDFIRYRIKHGKEGATPAFGETLSDADIDKIIAYIRNLKPDTRSP